MSDDGDRKLSPLWHYMRSMEHAPPPARPRAGALPPRETTREDLRPLRGRDLDWSPSSILEWFGPARDDAEHLGRLLVAYGVLQGPHRVRELTERLRTVLVACAPRIAYMRSSDTFERRKADLAQLLLQLEASTRELVQTRARASNDMDQDAFANPDGLRMVDLLILSEAVTAAVVAQEISHQRNVAGLDYGMAVARQAPDLRRSEEWSGRLMGASKLNGVLFFWPPEYGRVVIVYEDGRLAYDPGAPVESDEG